MRTLVYTNHKNVQKKFTEKDVIKNVLNHRGVVWGGKKRLDLSGFYDEKGNYWKLDRSRLHIKICYFFHKLSIFIYGIRCHSRKKYKCN